MEARSQALGNRVLDARQDSTDFRDLIYQPVLEQLPRERLPATEHIHIRDQGREGACTGFGLAAVIDYLNQGRVRAGVLDGPWEEVSTRMLYEMARCHDRWPGEDYEGSSARGAMKGWHKNGVCPEADWRYVIGESGALTAERAGKALRYPLGAYYRVLPRRSDFQAAILEAQVLFVTARVHAGWNDPRGGVIRYQPEAVRGGHAFAVVGYTERGFIVQNSWGNGWGGLELGGRTVPGLALWTYEDFEASLMDAWVARMALPVESLLALRSGAIAHVPGGPRRIEAAPPRHEIALNYVHIDDGRYDPRGDYPSNFTQVDEIVQRAAGAKHLVLYAHGGLNSVAAAASRVAAWKPAFERNDVYAVHFIWETGLLAELRDVLLGKEDLARDRVGGFLSGWWDSVLEKATWPLGRPLWKEMISDAEIAFPAGGGPAGPAGTDALERLIAAIAPPGHGGPTIHLVGHSAGSIWLSHLLARWKSLGGPPIQNLIFLAAACTHQLYADLVRPRMRDRSVEELSLFMLSAEDEKDDTVQGIYRKSLLYLVSNSYQKSAGELIGADSGVPILGMAKFLDALEPLTEGYKRRVATYITGRDPETTSPSHGGFDNDLPTMNTMLRLVLGPDFDEAKAFRLEEVR